MKFASVSTVNPKKLRRVTLFYSCVILFQCERCEGVNRPDIDLITLNPPGGFRIGGALPGSQSGYSVCGVGDTNGDGIDDIVVGAPKAVYQVGEVTRYQGGVSYVIFGRSANTGAVSSTDIDLSLFSTGNARGFTIFGADTENQSGFSVSKAGDVNGDSLSDIIIGAFFANPLVGQSSRVEAGVSYVVFGRAASAGAKSFENINLATFDTTTALGFRIVGAEEGDNSGYSVSGAGDVNDDGLDDVIVGAYLADVISMSGGRDDCGIAYVIFGRDVAGGESPFDPIDLVTFATGTVYGFSIIGAAAGDFTGMAVSGAGDVNGDGIQDIIIGAPTATIILGDDTRTGSGVAYVIFGRALDTGPDSYENIELTNFAFPTTQGYRILGAISTDSAGNAVSAAGDVNGDSVGDVIVGARYADAMVDFVGRVDSGIAYVVFGRHKSLGDDAFTEIDLFILDKPNTLGFSILGGAADYQCGVSVSTAGDINQDGVSDVMVGAHVADVSEGNNVRIFAGVTYVVYGRATFGNAVYSDPVDLATFTGNSTQGFRILGEAASDFSGYSVNMAGDVNADGKVDLLVGAFSADSDDGMTYVLLMDAVNSPTSQPSTQPTAQPSTHPTAQPSSQPSRQPSEQPTQQPTMQPTGQPSTLPSAQPTAQPSTHPTRQPSSQPTQQPSVQPTGQPSAQPTSRPSTQPSCQPSRQPTQQPTTQPSRQPSSQPSAHPTAQPSSQPSLQPSLQPTVQPTSQPTAQPSAKPSVQPSQQPTSQPLRQPSTHPSALPTSQPSVQPSALSSMHPSTQPSAQPTQPPTSQPSSQPSRQPSAQPTLQPSAQPSLQPSIQPTMQPSGKPSAQPLSAPTVQPTEQPTGQPSSQPTIQPTGQPCVQPSTQPSVQPTGQPSAQPSTQPSLQPSSQPTALPSVQPTLQPSMQPTTHPSVQPTQQPSGQPSGQPSEQPTGQPSSRPSQQPTGEPSTQPSSSPSTQPSTRPSSQPSEPPSSQPSSQPTVQPSSVPSSQPSCQPSSAPTLQPFASPTAQPSAQPSGQPTCSPSVQPSGQPSSKPSSAVVLSTPPPTPLSTVPPSACPSACPSSQPSSQPSAQPSTQPATQPTSQPSMQPSGEPSGQPRAVPTTQPTVQPSSHLITHPTSQPTSQPSTQPTFQPVTAPTGEWATSIVQDSVLVTEVAYSNTYVWACGSDVDKTAAVCLLAEATTGTLLTQYRFDWNSVMSVLSTATAVKVVVNGHTTSGATTNTDIAVCILNTLQLRCAVTSFLDANYLAASFLPYPSKVVYVGWYNVHTSISVLDMRTNGVLSYIYTAYNMKTLTLSQVQSPPAFVGSFVAGTAIRATAAPVNYIVVGMVRTDAGILSAMALSPVKGDVLNTADLVTAMALEPTGPDSFIAGGLHLTDTQYKHAYLVRANALFSSVQYCVRYRHITSGRRTLSVTGAASGVVRGMVYVDKVLFMIVDHTYNNHTSLTVLKTSATTGDIVTQVHITAPHTNLHCTDITVNTFLLNIVCTVQNNRSQPLSLLLSVDQELSFTVLPVGFVRSNESILQAENIPFQRTILAITKKVTSIATSTYSFDSADRQPTPAPSIAPSVKPSMQPSSVPSAQPSSNPTAEPTVSARPTSQPSSATPTNTHKPSTVPKLSPTPTPTCLPTPRPSLRPTTQPSAQPTVQLSTSPTVNPSVAPTVVPTRLPSVKPTTAPSRRPSVSTRAPSTTPTSAEDVVIAESRRKRTSSYVLGGSLGAGLSVLLIGYVVYKYHQHVTEAKAKEQRRAEFHLKQAALAEQARLETERFLQREEDFKLARRLAKQKQQTDKQVGKSNKNIVCGAFATRPALSPQPPLSPRLTGSDRSFSESVIISSLHSSERSSEHYRDQCEDSGSEESEVEGSVGESCVHSSDSDIFSMSSSSNNTSGEL